MGKKVTDETITDETTTDKEGDPNKKKVTDETITDETTTDEEGDPNKKNITDETTTDKEEMCPDIKKWLLGGSIKDDCYYTGGGCSKCFGKTYTCSFDYKKKGCDKKTKKNDAVQELVDMDLITDEEKTKIKKVLRINDLENPLHCFEKKKKIQVAKTRKQKKNTESTETPQEKTTEKKIIKKKIT